MNTNNHKAATGREAEGKQKLEGGNGAAGKRGKS